MNKLYLSSVLLAIFALPAFANIDKSASTATCDSATIGAISGNAYMDTAWTANTINLDFYSDGEKISTGSCTYDGAIELPEDPEDKTGYTFGGWQLRRAVASTTLDMTTVAQYLYGQTGGEFAYVKFDGTPSINGRMGEQAASLYNIETSGEWVNNFSSGIVKGIARCSTVGEGYETGQNGNPTDDLAQNAQYCWCRMTGYDAEKDGAYMSVTNSMWVLESKRSDCSTRCPYSCGYGARATNDFRRGLLKPESEYVYQQNNVFDLRTLSQYLNMDGVDYGWGTNTIESGVVSNNISQYDITSFDEWATEFSYGTVKGVARCSSTGGEYAVAGVPVAGTGSTSVNCWCKVTEFAMPNSSSYMSVASSSWVFAIVDSDKLYSSYGYSLLCPSRCAMNCANYIRNYSDFRRAIYGITQ